MTPLTNIFIVLVLLVVYGLVIWGLALASGKLGVPASWRIAVGFLVFAAGAGLWATLAWPYDVITLINLPAVLLGDALYTGSIRLLGDPSSAQAHFTTPWPFRVPQVHFLASLIVWGVLGLVVQLAVNIRRARRNPSF